MSEFQIDDKSFAKAIVSHIDWLDFRKSSFLSHLRFRSRAIEQQIILAIGRPNCPQQLSHGARVQLVLLAAYDAMPHFEKFLGINFAEPTIEQLNDACDYVEALSKRYTVICALAGVILSRGKASDHAAALLLSRYSIEVPQLQSGLSADSKTQVPPAREQRPRVKKTKKKKPSALPAPPKRRRPPLTTDVHHYTVSQDDQIHTPLSAVALQRWTPTLTPKLESEGFDVDHPLVGSIVWALVRFHDNPSNTKERPAVVIAVAKHATIVRGLYSKDGSRGRPFDVWQHYDLDHLGYISEVDEFAVRLPKNPRVIGRLNDAHWNMIR